ncbi:MAG: phosphoribosylglycinamide formyltransferase [Deltaproteobacteria bacterium]|nr:phosphoribosylglycinamide formyltransferase [Deltaproteobacteria bacterium]
MNVAVLISGEGTNLQAILDYEKEWHQHSPCPFHVALVLSNRKEALGLRRASNYKVPTVVVDPKEFQSRESFDEALIHHLEQHQIKLVVLAGFMRILTPLFVRKYYGRLLNIHPALLPQFPGTDAIQNALKAGVKKTGATVHFVDEGVDTGPIIKQEVVPVEQNDSLETLSQKIHSVEHRLYPEVIRLFGEGKIHLRGRNVRVDA